MTDETKGEPCQRCAEVDHDRRTLWMACFYEMGELEIPFEVVELAVNGDPTDKRRFFTLRVCKRCRAEWMASIKDWFDTKPHDRENQIGEDGMIYVRKFGHEVPVVSAEWGQMNTGREPYVAKKPE
jgi:hypothetical protein